MKPYTFLRKLICQDIYGEKIAGVGIRPSASIESLNHRLDTQGYGYYLSNAKIKDHVDGNKTYYCYGNPDARYSLFSPEIDVKKIAGVGSTAGATQFAELIKNQFFPNLYYEPSTSGNGIHPYIIIDKGNRSANHVNDLCRKLVIALNQYADTVHADIEKVEAKGTMPIKYGRTYKALGTLIKLPREFETRFDEFKRTTVLTPLDLTILIAKIEKAIPPKTKVQKLGGSQPYLNKTFISMIPAMSKAYKDHAYYAYAMHHAPAGRKKLTAQDFVQAFIVLNAFALDPNEDGQLPKQAIKAVWDQLYDAGIFTRAFDNSRFAAIRNSLADCGMLDLVDSRYWFFEDDNKKGMCMKWSLKASFCYFTKERKEERDILENNSFKRKPDTSFKPSWRPILYLQGRNTSYYFEDWTNNVIKEYDYEEMATK